MLAFSVTVCPIPIDMAFKDSTATEVASLKKIPIASDTPTTAACYRPDSLTKTGPILVR
jgi:hypothetical protein